MTTVQILQESVQPGGQVRYRAIHRNGQAAGATPGAALDALEDLLPDDSGTLVILQKLSPMFTLELNSKRVSLN